jgi:hypothetical protein
MQLINTNCTLDLFYDTFNRVYPGESSAINEASNYDNGGTEILVLKDVESAAYNCRSRCSDLMQGDMSWYNVDGLGKEPEALVEQDEWKIIVVNDSGLEALLWNSSCHEYCLVSLRRPTKKECAVFVWECPYGYNEPSPLTARHHTRVVCNYRDVTKAEGLRTIADGDDAPDRSWLPEEERC